MNRTLLDTDILSDFLRGQNSNVLRRAQAYIGEHGRLTLSAVTVFEVVRGRYQAQQLDRAAQFLAWLQNAEVLAFDDKSARLGGEIAQPGTLPATRSLRSHHRELAGIGLRLGLSVLLARAKTDLFPRST